MRATPTLAHVRGRLARNPLGHGGGEARGDHLVEARLHGAGHRLQLLVLHLAIDRGKELVLLLLDVMLDQLLAGCHLRLEGLVLRIGRQEALQSQLGERVLLVALVHQIGLQRLHRRVVDVLLDRHVRRELVRQLGEQRLGLGATALQLLEDRLHVVVLTDEESGDGGTVLRLFLGSHAAQRSRKCATAVFAGARARVRAAREDASRSARSRSRPRRATARAAHRAPRRKRPATPRPGRSTRGRDPDRRGAGAAECGPLRPLASAPDGARRRTRARRPRRRSARRAAVVHGDRRRRPRRAATSGCAGCARTR